MCTVDSDSINLPFEQKLDVHRGGEQQWQTQDLKQADAVLLQCQKRNNDKLQAKVVRLHTKVEKLMSLRQRKQGKLAVNQEGASVLLNSFSIREIVVVLAKHSSLGR